jgi:hypothetical protein
MRWLLVLAVGVFAAGCGGGRENTADEKIRAQMAKVETTCAEGVNCGDEQFRPFTRCTHVSGGFRACTRFFALEDEQSAIYRQVGGRWAKVVGPLPGEHGWWRRVVASPSGATLLGQWSGECEIQETYLLSPAGGKARPIFAGRFSTVVGWARDGRARVLLPVEIWGRRKRLFRAGIYRIDPSTLAASLERTIPARNGC